VGSAAVAGHREVVTWCMMMVIHAGTPGSHRCRAGGFVCSNCLEVSVVGVYRSRSYQGCGVRRHRGQDVWAVVMLVVGVVVLGVSVVVCGIGLFL
jgi:hypothetical protein